MTAALQQAYDEAAAVFSRRFRFVEWKYVIPAKGKPIPFGDKNQPRHAAVRDIPHPVWIYVFRQRVGEEYAAIKEEIFLDGKEMKSTPAEDLEKEPKARGKAAPLGQALSLPRRVMGRPQAYRFYASRVRLSAKLVKKLQSVIHTFAPSTLLDPGDTNTSVVEKDGELLVPVVDPITVALHLHAAYEAAANDIIDYTVAHDGLSTDAKKTVLRRRKKHLLATILKGIIGEENTPATSVLVNRLKGNQGPLEDFLAHYEGEVQERVNRRDRMANWLTKWLRSDGMAIAQAAHGAKMDDWVKFLVPWCRALRRLGESPTGRQYLVDVLKNDKHFAHTYVWPKKDLTEDQFQAARKGGLTLLEGWKTLSEARVLLQSGGDAVTDVVTSLRRLRRWKADTLKLTTTSISQVAGLDRTIKATKLIALNPPPELTHFPDEPTSGAGGGGVALVIESINLLFAINSASDKLKSADRAERELALIGLIGSGLDTASALGSLLKVGERKVATLGFVSGVIDVYLGVKEMDKAFKEGDQDAADGAFITAVGASMATSAALMTLMAIPGGQIVGAIGFAIVAIGYIYKIIKGKDPIERFFQYCSWGELHGKSGKPDWSPSDFKDWADEQGNGLDLQLTALLNIICKIEISANGPYRNLQYKVGWIPLGAKLVVSYKETWKKPSDSKEVNAEIEFASSGEPSSSSVEVQVSPNGKFGAKVTVLSSAMPRKSANQPKPIGKVYLPEDDLKRAEATGRLLVSFEGTGDFKIPHKDVERVVFHS